MPTVLKTKNSVTTTVAPTSLAQGELAVNITDKKMWVGNAATTPVQLFGAGADGSFVNLAYTGTLTGGTGVVNLGSGQFYKDASGNVGIGTASPAFKLDIRTTGSTLNRPTAGSVTGQVDWHVTNTGADVYFGVDGSAGAITGTAYGAYVYNSANTPLTFYTNGAERMRIDSSGNVGIGVTPSSWSLGKAIEVGYLGNAVWSFNQADIYYSSNTYYNSGWKYASSNSAGVGVYEINGNTHYWYGATAGTTGNSLTLTTILQLKQGNSLALQGGSNYTGTGISFPPTQNAVSDANTLDDYEEGSWTPTLFGSSTSGTSVYVIQEGTYTKIGRQVTINGYMNVVSTTGTGQIRIGGLPFTTGQRSAGAVMANDLNWGGGTYLMLYASAGQTSLEMYYITDDAGWVNQPIGNESQSFIFTYTYFV
jgi:hypothetical protein